MPKTNAERGARSAARSLVRAIALAIAAGVAAAAVAQETDPKQRYRECLALAREDPEEAFEQAIAWRDLGGGNAARHCVAVALIELEKFEQAAARLETLATEMKASANMKAAVLGQSGQAWMMAGGFERANGVLSAALELIPQGLLAADLLVDRGVVLAGAKNYWEAIDDFNAAIEIAPERAEAYVFRAAAYRYVDSFELALDDIERALEIESDHLQALLERGIIRRLQNDIKGARADWLRIITHAPESPTAKIARANIERLELGYGGQTRPHPDPGP